MAASRLSIMLRTQGQAVSIERNTPTKNSTGGDVPSWATLAGAETVYVMLWPKKHQGYEQGFGGRKDWEGEFEILMDQDYGAKPGDRLKQGTTYYEIKASNPYEAGWSSDTPQILECTKRKVS